jgi:hypothetical protein
MKHIALVLAALLTLSMAQSASAATRHKGAKAFHGGTMTTRNVSMPRNSGGPASVSPSGGDRAPVTGGS